MTLEIQTYTDSALSDRIKEFFNQFKENNNFKYVDLIDTSIIQSKIIEINYDDFTDEIKTLFDSEPIQRLDIAIKRAIGEIFQIRYGSEELEQVKQENQINFKIKHYRDEKPIKQIEDYLNTKIKNDPILVKQLLRAYLSTYTDNPINMALLAPSSDGKTYATVQVSKLFPKEDIIKVGRLSPTALIHQNGFLIDENGNNIQDSLDYLEHKIAETIKENDKDEVNNLKKQKEDLLKSSSKCIDLKNKILLFLDNPNPATYEMLKPIMSHDDKEITYMTTKGDGSLSVKKSVIRNWPVFIFCSAKNEDKNEVWEEIKTRVFMTSPNSDVTKYKEANKLTSKKFARPTWGKGLYENEEDKKWSKFYVDEIKTRLTTLCKDGNNPIINPFDDIITEKFPSNQGVSMRHFIRLMSFINLETLLNSEYNPELHFKTKDDQTIRSTFTTINDIGDACNVLKNISTISPEKLKFIDNVFTPLFEEVNTVQENLTEQQQKLIDKKGLTSSQLASKYTDVFKKQITNKQVLENYLNPLEDAGVLSSEQNPSNVSQKVFHLASTVTIHNLKDLKSKLIEASKPTLGYIDTCLEELEKVSIEIRKSKIIYKHNDSMIDLSKLKEILFGNSGNQSKLKEINP